MQLTTLRLVLREIRGSDLPALQALYADPLVRRYEGPLLSAKEVEEILSRVLEAVGKTPRIFYPLALTIPPSDELRGWLKLTRNNSIIREWEIGWALHPAEWGKGYATEAASALMQVAFEYLDAHRVVAFCHSENAASSRVMQKLGMVYEGRTRETTWVDDAWADELVYAILDWEFGSATPSDGT